MQADRRLMLCAHQIIQLLSILLVCNKCAQEGVWVAKLRCRVAFQDVRLAFILMNDVRT